MCSYIHTHTLNSFASISGVSLLFSNAVWSYSFIVYCGIVYTYNERSLAIYTYCTICFCVHVGSAIYTYYAFRMNRNSVRKQDTRDLRRMWCGENTQRSPCYVRRRRWRIRPAHHTLVCFWIERWFSRCEILLTCYAPCYCNPYVHRADKPWNREYAHSSFRRTHTHPLRGCKQRHSCRELSRRYCRSAYM